MALVPQGQATWLGHDFNWMIDRGIKVWPPFPIEPALLAWLRRAIKLGCVSKGPILPFTKYNDFRNRIRLLAKDAGVTWKQNAMRHLYASYWLEQNDDLNKLALYLGHVGGLDVLHRFYHRSVRTKEAKAFWAQRPGSTEQKSS